MAEKTSSQPIRQVVLRVNVRVTPPHTTTSAQAHVQTREKIAPANKRFTVTCLDTDSFARASIERRQITQVSKREVDCQQHTCTHIQTQKQAATHNTDTHTETVMVMHAIALVSGTVGMCARAQAGKLTEVQKDNASLPAVQRCKQKEKRGVKGCDAQSNSSPSNHYCSAYSLLLLLLPTTNNNNKQTNKQTKKKRTKLSRFGKA